jgi:hypothetical protein
MKEIIYKIMMLLSLTVFFSPLILISAKAAYNAMPPSTMPPSPTTTIPTTPSPPPNPGLVDAKITVDLQNKIASNPNLAGLGIMVSTTNGIVTLEGYVRTQTQSDLVVNLAKSLPGVKDVQSKIIIKQQ